MVHKYIERNQRYHSNCKFWMTLKLVPKHDSTNSALMSLKITLIQNILNVFY